MLKFTRRFTTTVGKYLADKKPTHAIVEIYERPYTISKTDVVVVPRLKNYELGDLIVLDRVREVGFEGGIIKGNPYLNLKVECCLIEHIEGTDTTRRHKKRSGDDKYVTNRECYSLLRVREFL